MVLMSTCSFTWQSWRMYQVSFVSPKYYREDARVIRNIENPDGFLLCNVPSLAGTRLLMLENFSHTNKVCWFCQTDGVGVKHERSHKARLAEFRKAKYEQKDETRALVSILWKAYSSEIKLVSSQIWRYIIFLSQQQWRKLDLISQNASYMKQIWSTFWRKYVAFIKQFICFFLEYMKYKIVVQCFL